MTDISFLYLLSHDENRHFGGGSGAISKMFSTRDWPGANDCLSRATTALDAPFHPFLKHKPHKER